MGLWIASQSDSFNRAQADGALWIPARAATKGWKFNELVGQIEPGDVLFSLRAKSVVAILVARSKREIVLCPYPSPNGRWSGTIYRVKADYLQLDPPISTKPLTRLYRDGSSRRRGIAIDGAPSRGYLHALDYSTASQLLRLVGVSVRTDLDGLIIGSAGETTNRTSLVKLRKGQDRFREKLIARWGRVCAVSGLSLLQLLRASHIKPWVASNDEERLDAENGILLSPLYDSLFDEGYITFDREGNLLISGELHEKDRKILGIGLHARIEKAHLLNDEYLSYHRTSVFRSPMKSLGA